jgi:hypothetical protein
MSAPRCGRQGDRRHEIERLVKQQEDAGLQLATDGKLRRSWWHLSLVLSSPAAGPTHCE